MHGDGASFKTRAQRRSADRADDHQRARHLQRATLPSLVSTLLA